MNREVVQLVLHLLNVSSINISAWARITEEAKDSGTNVEEIDIPTDNSDPSTDYLNLELDN